MKKFQMSKTSTKTVFIVYIAIMLILFTLLFSAYFQVSYGIGLSDETISKGNNVTLNYEIYNKMLLDAMNNVLFDYWIEDGDTIVLNVTEIKLGIIYPLKDYKSSISVDTSQLDIGEYRVWTRVTYSVGEGEERVGNRYAQLLSLKLTII